MTEVRDTEKLSRADKKVIAKFLDKNYQYGYDSGSKVKADDTYRLFIEVYPGRNVSKARLTSKWCFINNFDRSLLWVFWPL